MGRHQSVTQKELMPEQCECQKTGFCNLVLLLTVSVLCEQKRQALGITSHPTQEESELFPIGVSVLVQSLSQVCKHLIRQNMGRKKHGCLLELPEVNPNRINT